jgi:hypothetical protein
MAVRIASHTAVGTRNISVPLSTCVFLLPLGSVRAAPLTRIPPSEIVHRCGEASTTECCVKVRPA